MGRKQGFTLIEAVVVIAIIGIVVALGVVRLSQVQSRARTREAIVMVAGMLQQARDSAIASGVPNLVYFADSGSCAGEREPLAQIVRDNDSSCSPTPGDTQVDFRLTGSTARSPLMEQATTRRSRGCCPPMRTYRRVLHCPGARSPWLPAFSAAC
jgi:prepilin-type N-terminal cleavage/methylation domain-containing protein